MPELVLQCADSPQVVIELEVDTPQIRSLTGALPQTGIALHSRRSGYEIVVALPLQLPDDWGATERRSLLEPGTVIACGYPANHADAPPDAVIARGTPYTHIGIAYDHDTRFATQAGYVEVGVLGRVTSSLSELKQLGQAIRAGSRSFSLTTRREAP